MIRTIDELIRCINENPILAPYQYRIVSESQKSIHIKRIVMPDDDIPFGHSKFGGHPDLPADFEWQYYDDEPLTFIAQFRLSELTQYDVEGVLPTSGILYLFYPLIGASSYGEKVGQIFYIEDEATPLIRTPPPSGGSPLKSHQITYQSIITIPNYSIYTYPTWVLDSTDPTKTQNEMAYWSIGIPETVPQPNHFLLGHANPIHDGILESTASAITYYHEKRYLSREERSELADRWQFLFQIDSDDSLDVMWGDMGILYISIPKASLQQKRFEDGFILMQCG